MSNIALPIAVHIFLLKENKVLLMERINTGFQDGKWSVPAGRLELNETIRSGAVREAKEEVGVFINNATLNKPLVMHHKDERGERIYFFFTSHRWEGEIKNCEPAKCSRIDWFEIKKLPENIVPHIRVALNKMREGETYVEFGF